MKSGAVVAGAVAVAVGATIIIFLQTSGDRKPGVKMGIGKAVASCTNEGLRCLPKVTFVDTEGEAITPEVLEGKVVMVNFWATWCKPCKKEIPALSATFRKHADEGFFLFGVITDDVDATELEEFAQQTDLRYPVVRADYEVLEAFEYPSGLPTTFVYDRTGTLRFHRRGAVTERELEDVLKDLLAEQAQGARRQL